MPLKGYYLVGRSENKAQEVEIFRKLNKGVEIELAYFEDIIPMTSTDGTICVRGEMVRRPDFVINRTFKTGGNDMQFKAVMAMFDAMGVLCVNSPEASRVTSDKLLCFQIAQEKVPEVRIPKTMLVTPETDAKAIGTLIGYPLVIKVMHGSKGKGVTLVRDEETLKAILDTVQAATFDDQLLAQKAILTSRGRDVRIVVAFGHAIGAYQRVNPSEFRSNINQGGHGEPYDPPESLKQLAVRLADAFGLAMGGIDFLFGDKPDEFWFCEANSLIGMSALVDGFKKGDMSEFSNYMDLDKLVMDKLGEKKAI